VAKFAIAVSNAMHTVY